MKNENKSVPCYITEERLSYKQRKKTSYPTKK